MTRPDLRLVSLTGADDRTDLKDLKALAGEFPFVEWALLYGPKPGTPRNPTQAWREAFFDAQLPCSSAVHLCGKEAFIELLEDRLPEDVRRASRIQLNVNARRPDFSFEEILAIYARALELGPDVILQHHSGTRVEAQLFVMSLAPRDRKRVHVLLDESRGTGTSPAVWTVPHNLVDTYVGHAGGVGPENISEVLAQLEALGRPYWVDMESKIRTDNAFDTEKSAQVLKAAATYL